MVDIGNLHVSKKYNKLMSSLSSVININLLHFYFDLFYFLNDIQL
jgi:hypothetical protein